MVLKIGISLYLGSGFEKNREIVEKARAAHVEYAFTSLHIPEETGFDSQTEIQRLLKLCQENGIHLITDISPNTLPKLGCSSFDELEKTNVSCIRLDFGFTLQEAADFTHRFQVVINASTIQDGDVQELRRCGADFGHITACHNFYPKPLTGLSLEKVAKINQRAKQLGFVTMGFVAGDRECRGPLFEGLPTAEAHRRGDVFVNMLELHEKTDMDIVLIGDVDVTDAVWERIREYHEGYISLSAEVEEPYAFLRETVHHDRVDSSDYVIRSVESRTYKQHVPKAETKPRKKGSISIGNEAYLRYSGEVEIARIDLEEEERVNIVGRIAEADFKYLPYIRDGLGFQLN